MKSFGLGVHKRAGLGVSPSNLKDYNHENHLKYYQSEISTKDS